MKGPWKIQFVEMLNTTEHKFISLVIDMLDDVQNKGNHNDNFILDLLNAKKALKKLLPYF